MDVIIVFLNKEINGEVYYNLLLSYVEKRVRYLNKDYIYRLYKALYSLK
jgi:hypothetical protein